MRKYISKRELNVWVKQTRRRGRRGGGDDRIYGGYTENLPATIRYTEATMKTWRRRRWCALFGIFFSWLSFYFIFIFLFCTSRFTCFGQNPSFSRILPEDPGTSRYSERHETAVFLYRLYSTKSTPKPELWIQFFQCSNFRVQRIPPIKKKLIELQLFQQ